MANGKSIIAKEMWSPACTRHVREWNQFRTESERRVREFFQRTL